MDGIDTCHYGPGLRLGAEAELEHRMERAMKAPHMPAPFGMEAAVIGDTAGDERVRKLEKNSGAPGEQEDHFSLKLPSDGLDRRKRCGHVCPPDPR
jgi:hypothetical protein